ncbi:TPA: hypothetical protein PTV74_003286 [Clostridium botulinum]|nr:hypothetical protein [Clostridium botulinum]HDK7206440.1 hypothetical protein [Clostridium botulinum]HDK7210176.1 hypothetical protein [Clostridium botulinum]HDK7265625.1 hypothetical protein [Clostridium botulinum]HDK7269473.1 hypothetical protein [Clostridium botulinum]
MGGQYFVDKYYLRKDILIKEEDIMGVVKTSDVVNILYNRAIYRAMCIIEDFADLGNRYKDGDITIHKNDCVKIYTQLVGRNSTCIEFNNYYIVLNENDDYNKYFTGNLGEGKWRRITPKSYIEFENHFNKFKKSLFADLKATLIWQDEQDNNSILINIGTELKYKSSLNNIIEYNVQEYIHKKLNVIFTENFKYKLDVKPDITEFGGWGFNEQNKKETCYSISIDVFLTDLEFKTKAKEDDLE